MKKIALLAVAALLVAAPVFSQVSKEPWLKKIAKSDADITDAKKNIKSSTWMSRGKLFFEAETAIVKNLHELQSMQEVEFYLGVPKSKEQAEVGGMPYIVLGYPELAVYINNQGAVAAWKVTDEVYPGAIDKAFEAYTKAIELDAKGSDNKKIRDGIAGIYNYVYRQGSVYYILGEYEKSGDSFMRAYEVATSPAFPDVDYSIVRDAGIAYSFAGKFDKALNSFLAAEQGGYTNEGEIYSLIYDAIKAVSAEAASIREGREYLKKGLMAYPTNDGIVERLADAYVLLGENLDEIIPVLEQSIENDPQNPYLWNALGRIYDKQGNYDKAIEVFNKLNEIMPDNYGVYFTLGALYARKGDVLNDKVNEQASKGKYVTQKQLDNARKEVYGAWGEAIAPLEKAYELYPGDDALMMIRTITFRLRETSKEMKDKFNKYNEIHKQKQAQ